MKTNKEIKPFKMRCESKDEYCTVKRILEECGVNIQCREGTNDILINAYFRPEGLVYTTFEKHFDEPEPELTYSEFIKLYGEEEEVFTREYMVGFANWIMLFSMDYVSMTGMFKPNGDVITADDLLTNFLSERTND